MNRLLLFIFSILSIFSASNLHSGDIKPIKVMLVCATLDTSCSHTVSAFKEVQRQYKRELGVTLVISAYKQSRKITNAPSIFRLMFWAADSSDEFIKSKSDILLTFVDGTNEHNTVDDHILGLASGIGVYKRSIMPSAYVRVGSFYNTVATTKHELAHLLGAEHSDDGDIMSSSLSGCITNKFGPTTKERILGFLRYINRVK